MELTEIIKEIEEQKSKLEQVLIVLSGKVPEGPKTDQETVTKVAHAIANQRKHHTMSAAGKRKVAAAQRARWAKVREERKKAA